MPTTTKAKKDSKAIVPKVPKESFYGTGRRKTAVARVWLFKGTGNVFLNNKPMAETLTRDTQQIKVLKPLNLLKIKNGYDVVIKTTGGGLTGQVDASLLGIARALMVMNGEFRAPLKSAGLITRDSREKERKKYGRKRARKGFQYRKR